ncbi:MAG TPA: ABC transporter ATP-binding protein [Haliea salexigens]|uniref:ABC transporter ATP-binding protein n=1 Tax=Haliea salexigens TaxID=287487 RepID=A0A3C1KM57_9GAMM|nr:ABC transporter ATP-binding protein [Haliea salexigens]HAN27747.1 ABC transporter ATP-binding protein [Haliea salexigens]|tara:strand:+ start:7661 stop:8524 length:864 start_codon:yes stop_codon:yes gene_type:complete
MRSVVEARGLQRRFGQQQALAGVDLQLEAGSVLGLIGPNGAGKTTLLRSLLGLTRCEGELTVLGVDPRRDHARLMQDACFIADTAVLPRWMRVDELLDYTDGVHSRFNRAHAVRLLAGTEVGLRRRIGELSKGMTVQLHLALVMAIDARLLILDEPTLGLDILFRKQFFEQLLNDYFDEERTIIISTHQVEEVENILTHVMFMNRGRGLLCDSMLALEERYVELRAVGEAATRAAGIPHLGQRPLLGGKALIYEDVNRDLLAPLGDLRTPALADLFVAKVAEDNGHE